MQSPDHEPPPNDIPKNDPPPEQNDTPKEIDLPPAPYPAPGPIKT